MKGEVEKKKKSIIVYFIEMFLIFVVIDFLMMFSAQIVVENSSMFKYGRDLLLEVFYALIVLVVMLLFDNSYVFTNKQEKFSKSIKLGLPIIATSIVFLISNLLSIESFSVGNFINVFFLCISIGFAEEFLCRGWLQNEFIERYGDNKKNVITSIILSSAIFGLMHILNASTQDLFQTILQVTNAFCLGLLFGSIYYKTKNIWAVIFLHAFYDFSLFLGEFNLVKNCTYGKATSGVVVVEIISLVLLCCLWILGTIFVLKKCNFPGEKASRRKKTTLLLCMAVVFLLNFVPFQLLVPEYDNYQVCYNYEKIIGIKNYTTHYQHYDKYYINSNKDEIIYSTSNGIINEIVTNSNHAYEFRTDPVNNKFIVKNINTGFEQSIEFNGNIEEFQVIENGNQYYVTIHTNENESTVYYSEYMTKDNLSNDREFLNDFVHSFVKFELPELEQVGYVTFSDNDNIYPFMYSKGYDYFMIKNGKLFLIDWD